jgi:outer membrane lipoprotein-sorting protein
MVSICSDLAAVRVQHAGIGVQPAGWRSVSRGRSAGISLCRKQILHSCSLKAALLPRGGFASTRCGSGITRPSHALCLLLCFVFSLAALLSRAAEAPKLDGLFGQWFAVQTNLQSWSADFTQTRSLKVLAQPLISTGKVWVATSRFRWELGQPPQTIALRQPDQLVIIYPRLKRAEKYPLSGVPAGPVKDAFALLDASLPRDRAAMEDRFRLLSAVETNATLQVTLQPKSASARKFISEIVIGFHTNDFAIAMTEMQFADGSILRNDFTNVVLNPAIPPEKFEAVLAPDVTVVEPLHR